MPLPTFTNPSGLLTPPGPYSQVARVGDLVFVSGQVGADAENVLVGESVSAQADQAFRNVAVALAGVGLGLEHIAKVTIFVPYPDDLPELVAHMDDVFPALFPRGYPASSLVVVQRLVDPRLRIEIEAVAHA
ncbi:RidA family protein [Microbacterium gorillae]|uniref:RidA family protein n=1 Tax=Microbacterium gorillae TaxID=1231063 RepID=UPI00058B4E1B|nr:RidA family protein [Microbacterium gorillae]